MNNEMTTDNMSNEEVIEVLKGIVFNGFNRTTWIERQALNLAIKALEEKPQGKWLLTPDKITSFKCSICNQPNFGEDNFCCNYGAKMKGGTNNGKQ